MAAVSDTKRFEDLAESDYRELDLLYGRLRGIQGFIEAMHRDYVDRGAPPSFDKIQALHLMTTETFGELERYLIPAYGADVAVNPAEREH